MLSKIFSFGFKKSKTVKYGKRFCKNCKYFHNAYNKKDLDLEMSYYHNREDIDKITCCCHKSNISKVNTAIDSIEFIKDINIHFEYNRNNLCEYYKYDFHDYGWY